MDWQTAAAVARTSSLLGDSSKTKMQLNYNPEKDKITTHFTNTYQGREEAGDIFIIMLGTPAKISDIENFIEYRLEQLKRTDNTIKHNGVVEASELTEKVGGLYGRNCVELIWNAVENRLESRLKIKGDDTDVKQRDYKKRYHIQDVCLYWDAQNLDDFLSWWIRRVKEDKRPQLEHFQICDVGVINRDSKFIEIDNDTYTVR